MITETMSEKKLAIFEATLDLASKQGIHATPMSQIAGRAETGIGTIYHYFPSKERLINDLYLELKAKALLAITPPKEQPGDPKGSFIAIIRNLIAYYAANPRELAFLEQCENSPLIEGATKAEAEAIPNCLTAALISASEKGLLKDLPRAIQASIIGGAAISLVKLVIASSSTLDCGIKDAISALWDAIAV